MAKKNPPWTNDEHILALDLYFDNHGHQLDKSDNKIIQLSNLLISLPIYDKENRTATFRNPAGVAMKLGNFKRLDDENEGIGLSHGAFGEETVWNKYVNNKSELKKVAEAIKSNIINVSIPTKDEELDFEFEEGKILTREHKYRERKSYNTEKKKKMILAKKGKLECEVCNFDFQKKYGDLGFGYAECHHTIPVLELKEGQKTKFSDLAILCANCHRMIHKTKPMLSVAQFKDQLSSL